MAFGFGFGMPRSFAAPAFTPQSLFSTGAQGAWYDPSDINLNWRYNLLTYTEQFDNAAWLKTNATVTANAVLAPDGTLTGDKLVENTSNAGHDVRQSGTISGTNTFSVYLKAAERTWALIQVGGTIAGFAYVNLTTGAIGTVTTGCTATAISVGNGWWRCSVTGVSASTSATVAGVYLALNDSSFQYTGDGTSGIYLWGAQLEIGSVATTYQQIVTPEISYLTYQPQPVLYQDAAGTTPVTAVEQPVGLMKDKSGRGNHAFQTTAASRPVLSARYNRLLATTTLATQNVTTVAATYILSFTGTGSITLSGTKTGTYTAGTNTLTGVTAGTLTLTVSGSVTLADLRVSNDALNQPAYQRVNTSTDYDTVGFKPYLLADGVDDGMVTNSINFTTTDKMTVCAGVRKLSDAAVGMIYELSAIVDNNNGSFNLFNNTDSKFTIDSKGTIRARTGITATPAAPSTVVVNAAQGIADDVNSGRINAGAYTTNSANQGTGNYGNYPLYLFRRGGTTLPFNGRMYEMTIVGKTLTAGELVNLETYTNNKTGAY